jgi:hypothetical protein
MSLIDRVVKGLRKGNELDIYKRDGSLHLKINFWGDEISLEETDEKYPKYDPLINTVLDNSCKDGKITTYDELQYNRYRVTVRLIDEPEYEYTFEMSQEVIEELKEKIDTDTLVGSDVQLTSVQEPYKFCDISIQNEDNRFLVLEHNHSKLYPFDTLHQQIPIVGVASFIIISMMLDVPLFDEELIGATIFAYIVYFLYHICIVQSIV